MLQCQKPEKNLSPLVSTVSNNLPALRPPFSAKIRLQWATTAVAGPQHPRSKMQLHIGLSRDYREPSTIQKRKLENWYCLLTRNNHFQPLANHKLPSSAINQPLSSIVNHYSWISTWRALIWQVPSLLDPLPILDAVAASQIFRLLSNAASHRHQGYCTSKQKEQTKLMHSMSIFSIKVSSNLSKPDTQMRSILICQDGIADSYWSSTYSLSR